MGVGEGQRGIAGATCTDHTEVGWAWVEAGAAAEGVLASIEVYSFGAVAGADSTGAVCMAAEPGARRTVDSTAAEAAEEEVVDNQGEMAADMTDKTGPAVWNMGLVPVASPTVSSCSCGAGFGVWGVAETNCGFCDQTADVTDYVIADCLQQHMSLVVASDTPVSRLSSWWIERNRRKVVDVNWRA